MDCGQDTLRGEDRVREMSRRLASGRRQHNERLQRNTDPIKDRQSISTALKGIPPCLPPSLVHAKFLLNKKQKMMQQETNASP